MAHEPIRQGPNTKVLQDGGRVERPAWECDTCTARWKIKTELVERAIPAWGEPHPYPSRIQLRKVSHAYVEERGGWTILDAVYKGVIGEMPKVKITDGQTIGTAQLERLAPDGSSELVPSTLNIQFYTPTTTYEYYSRKKPKGAIFKRRINWQEDSLQIIQRRGAGRNRDRVVLLSGKSLATATSKGGSEISTGLRIVAASDSYNGVAEVVTGDSKFEPIAEGLWKCMEKNEIQIFPYNFDRLVRIA